MTDFGAVASDTGLVRTLHFSGGSIGRGSTAPTEVLIGTSPEVPALLFDATGETAAIYASFFADMDLGASFTVSIQWALVNGQINADQLDLTLDYVVPLLGTTGNGPAKTSTQLLPTQQVTTAAGLAAGDVYDLTQVIAFDDATNPFAGGSGIALELHLTNVTGVAAIHLLDVDIEYNALY